MNNQEIILAEKLFNIGAIKFGNFKLKLHEKNPDAPLSPIYIDLRMPDHPTKPGPLTYELVKLIGRCLYDEACLLMLNYDYIAGVPYAGEPFAEAFSRLSLLEKNPKSRLRLKKEKNVDSEKIISIEEGQPIPMGATVLLIDDVITKADSKLKAISVLKQASLKVEDVLVVIDREQGGTEQLEKAGYNLYPIFWLYDLLDFYLKTKKINRAQYRQVINYLTSQ